MFVCLTATVLAASLTGASTPSYSVAVTRRVGLDAAAALDLAELFSQAVERQGEAMPGKRVSARAFSASLAAANSDPSSCAGAIDCAAVMGKVGEVDWLFALQLAKVGSNVICDATLLRVHDGASLATANKPVRGKDPVADLEALAKEIVAAAQPIQSPIETPVLATTQPAGTGTPSSMPVKTTPKTTAKPMLLGLWPGQVAAIGLAALAVVAVGSGAALGVTALNQADALSSKTTTFKADQDRVLWIARGADISYVASGAFIAAAAAVWLFLGQAPTEGAGAL